jgi:3-hydroxybutyryl-CoA dehydratase
MELGKEFSRKFVVDRNIYQGFRDLFNDNNPLHTFDEFAKQHGFSEKVMYGNILNGFISFFVGECLPIKNVAILSQTIDYKSPVYLNDILDLHAKITNIVEAVNVVEFKFKFINQNQINVAKGNIQIKII